MSLKDWFNKLMGRNEVKQLPVDASGLLINRETLPFTPVTNEVIYVNGSGDTTADRFVEDNLDALTAAFDAHGYRFTYLPRLGRRLAANEALWRYLYPAGDAPAERDLPSLPNDYMLRFMLHPENRDKVAAPAFLRLNPHPTTHHIFNRYQFEQTLLTPDYIGSIAHTVATVAVPVGRLYSRKKFENAEWDYDLEVERQMREVRDRINRLRQAGVSEVVLASLLEPQPEAKLSRLRVTADHRIFLTDYDNTEIEMTPLVKTVFFLYLRHPEGIRIKDLIDYRDELWIIYNILKGHYHFPINDIPAEIGMDVDEFVAGPPESIAALCDPTNNSINEKCARIKEAFLLRFHESLASRYYLTGARGEPKRITLPRDLVTWET